jgi:hypothetical protein
LRDFIKKTFKFIFWATVFSIIFNLWQERTIRPDVSFISRKYFDYKGVIHIHTHHSDGSGSFQEIGEIASKQGIDFIITTDHNTTQPIKDKKQDYYPKAENPFTFKTLVICGTEFSTKSGHLILIWDNPYSIIDRPFNTQRMIDITVSQKGTAIIAHPYRPRIEWKDWDINNFTGMEIYNFDEDWRTNNIGEFLISFISYPFSQASMNNMVNYPYKNMKRWDELTRGQNIVGIGVPDAHSRIDIGWERMLTFPSYNKLFKLVRTHIISNSELTGIYWKDRRIILDSIKKGHCYVAFDGFCNASGFLFGASDGTNHKIQGDSISVKNKPVTLYIETPDRRNSLIKVFRNGKEIFKTRKSNVKYDVYIPGVYRVEVYQMRLKLPLFNRIERPWIFSNPIYVTK